MIGEDIHLTSGFPQVAGLVAVVAAVAEVVIIVDERCLEEDLPGTSPVNM